MIAEVKAFRFNGKLFESKEKAEEYQKGDMMMEELAKSAPSLGEAGREQVTFIVLGKILKDKIGRDTLKRLCEKAENIWEKK